MKITSIDVISFNGKLTRGEGTQVHEWASKEDWGHFTEVRGTHNLLVMGRGSYEAVRPKPEPGLLRVVLTHHPELYEDQAMPEQLEFVNQSPKEAVTALEARGFGRMLIAGAQVNTQFFAANLVDDMYITLEPWLFAEGQPWLVGLPHDVRLRVAEDPRVLNARGTLLLHYSVDKTVQPLLS